jgi:hypothetical protein
MGRLACVLALLCVGCFRLPDVPKPPTPRPESAEMDRYFGAFRECVGKALGDTAAEVDGLDEVGYRKLLGKHLKAAAEAAHGELSATDQALSDGGYTPEKAKELLLRRQRECARD